jgi:Flp pilus assembly pilin Flp
MSLLSKFMRDESASAAAEYAVLLAFVGSAIVLSAVGLRNGISGSMTQISGRLDAIS